MGSYTLTVLTESRDISEVVKILAPFDHRSGEFINSDVPVYDYYMLGALQTDYIDFAPVFLMEEVKISGDDVLQLYYRKPATSLPSYLYDEFSHPYYSQRLTPAGYIWSNVARVADIEFDKMRKVEEQAVREELQWLKDNGKTGYIDDEIFFSEDGVEMHGSRWSSIEVLSRYRSMFHTHAVITPKGECLKSEDLSGEEREAVSRKDTDALLPVKERRYQYYLKFLREYPECYAWYVFCKSESK